MSADGANGISFMEAQGIYQRIGAMDKVSPPQGPPPPVRRALDPGWWRPFDLALDWTDPTLPGERWPKNGEALYYWRSTHWNGDPDRLSAPPREIIDGDRLVEHLRGEVPEIQPVVKSVEWRYGIAGPLRVCTLVAEVAVEAYRNGNAGPGLRIATALVPGLDETSQMFAPNSVVIGFLKNDACHDPSMQSFIAHWPSEIRGEIRQQQAFMALAHNETDRQAKAWSELWSTSHGQPVDLVDDQLHAIESYHRKHPGAELHLALTARVMTDQRWAFKHPLTALGLAWRHRRVQSPLLTLNWLRRPRFAG